MSIKSWIAQCLPRPLLHWIQKRLNQTRLNSVKTLPADVANLRVVTDQEIDSFFTSPDFEQQWQTAEEKLKAFDVPNMTGGVNPGDRRALFYLALGLNAKSVLEVGTHIGASTIHLASALKAVASDSENTCALTTVDIADVNDPQTRPWIKHGASHSPQEMINELGCEDMVQFQTRNSLEFLSSGSSRFDLIFLDGDHSSHTTYQEIPAALNRLNPGGTILLHDFFPDMKALWPDKSLIHGPCMAADRLKREGIRIRVIPLGELPWPTKLGSRYTSLALLSGIES